MNRKAKHFKILLKLWLGPVGQKAIAKGKRLLPKRLDAKKEREQKRTSASLNDLKSCSYSNVFTQKKKKTFCLLKPFNVGK